VIELEQHIKNVLNLNDQEFTKLLDIAKSTKVYMISRIFLKKYLFNICHHTNFIFVKLPDRVLNLQIMEAKNLTAMDTNGTSQYGVFVYNSIVTTKSTFALQNVSIFLRSE